MVFAGCGQVPRSDGDAGHADGSARIDDASTGSVDAATGPRAFGPPILISEANSDGNDRFGTVSDNGNTLFFTRTAVLNGFRVNQPYVARRENDGALYSPPTRTGGFGQTSISGLDVREDGLELIYWLGLGQLAKSSRSDLDDGWTAPIQLGFDGLSPSVSGDGMTLYYVSLDGYILTRSRSNVNGTWNAPSLVALLAFKPASTLVAIDVSSDELEMLLTTNAFDQNAGVYLASRPTRTAVFEVESRLFPGSFESARFRADGNQIVVTSTSNPDDRNLAISTVQ